MKQLISENSYISFTLFIAAISVVSWITMIYAQGNATAKTVESYSQTLMEINTRLARIEGAVGVKSKP